MYLIGVNVNIVEKKLDLLEIIMKIETLLFKIYIYRELNCLEGKNPDIGPQMKKIVKKNII